MMSAHHRKNGIGDFCVANYLLKLDMVHLVVRVLYAAQCPPLCATVGSMFGGCANFVQRCVASGTDAAAQRSHLVWQS